MSDMNAKVEETKAGFHVEGYEKIEYDFEFLDGIFEPANKQLADCYARWGRALAVMDFNIYDLYGDQMEAYFKHHNLELKIHKTMIGEKAKSIETLLSIVDSMNEFGVFRKEPVLVVGGGLVTDVAGFACAAYRRNTNFIRIPTTVIGLIDASVSIKVAVNYGNYKNRLGAYHAPIKTFLDFTFLRTLPEGQIRNGFAELIKISTCAHLETFNLLDKYCEEIIKTGFGRTDGASKEVREASDKINRMGIHKMLEIETPNLHEIGLDRIIAYGHTWSPMHELVPETPLRHGHAISIDMAYSATLAHERGLLPEADYKRILSIFSRAGLSMDHAQFDERILDEGTKAILKTRDGKLRAAVPAPLGECVFINDVTLEEMTSVLHKHKELMKQYPRNGLGLDAFVDSSDTGYTQNMKVPETNGHANNAAVMTDDLKKEMNGKLANGLTNGFVNGDGKGSTQKVDETKGHASGPEGVDGSQNGAYNGIDHHTNGD